MKDERTSASGNEKIILIHQTATYLPQCSTAQTTKSLQGVEINVPNVDIVRLKTNKIVLSIVD